MHSLVVQHGCLPGTPPLGFKRVPVNIGIRRYNSLNSYRTFFLNKLYIGILEFGDLTIEDYCQPIVDRKTWDAVQIILAHHAGRAHVSDPKHHPRRKSDAAPYPLSGIVHCARCGSSLYGMTSRQRNGTNYRRYACSKRTRTRTCDFPPIPAKSLEDGVIAELGEFFKHPENLRALIDEETAQLASQQRTANAALVEDRKRLAVIRRQITNITETIAELGKRKSRSLLSKLANL